MSFFQKFYQLFIERFLLYLLSLIIAILKKNTTAIQPKPPESSKELQEKSKEHAVVPTVHIETVNQYNIKIEKSKTNNELKVREKLRTPRLVRHKSNSHKQSK